MGNDEVAELEDIEIVSADEESTALEPDEEVDEESSETDCLDGEAEEYSANVIKAPLKAIKARCIDCCGGNYNFVKECPSVGCALYPFRKGRNPFRVKRVLTEEQRQAAAERLAKARNAKQD